MNLWFWNRTSQGTFREKRWIKNNLQMNNNYNNGVCSQNEWLCTCWTIFLFIF